MHLSQQQHREALRPLLIAALRARRLRQWAGGYLTVAGRRIDHRIKDDEVFDLETYLIDHCGLPEQELDAGLPAAFAEETRAVCRDQSLSLRISYNAVAWLLDGWRFLADASLPSDDPRVILPCCTAVGIGVHAVSFTAIAEGVRSLLRLIASPTQPVREAVIQGIRYMLEEDWPRTMYELRRYAHIGDPPEHYAAAAALADAALLSERERALDAVDLLYVLMAALRRRPTPARHHDDIDALCRALGQAIRAAQTAAPETTLAAAQTWLTWNDPDISRIVEENLDRAL